MNHVIIQSLSSIFTNTSTRRACQPIFWPTTTTVTCFSIYNGWNTWINSTHLQVSMFKKQHSFLHTNHNIIQRTSSTIVCSWGSQRTRRIESETTHFSWRLQSYCSRIFRLWFNDFTIAWPILSSKWVAQWHYTPFFSILRGVWWVLGPSNPSLSYVALTLRLWMPKHHPRLLLELSYYFCNWLISDNILFLKVGLLFVILGAVLFVIAFFRARHSSHDFADRHKEAQILDSGIKTEGQDNTRIFGRPFVTAGWTVVQVTVAVAVVELGLLGLIIHQVFAFLFSFMRGLFSFILS